MSLSSGPDKPCCITNQSWCYPRFVWTKSVKQRRRSTTYQKVDCWARVRYMFTLATYLYSGEVYIMGQHPRTNPLFASIGYLSQYQIIQRMSEDGMVVISPTVEAEPQSPHFSDDSDFDYLSVFKPSIQVIDENKTFNQGLLPYIQQFYKPSATSKADDGLNYHIVSVFGSQSTGKSTLLNKLFGTKFDVMNEVQRQQTTKGIWLSHANFISSSDDSKHNKVSNDNMNIFVMDVEGTDGRERGEDQDFERKSALFALSTSEVLIVNIWEHQVGLYNGANMGLLKTVFEVNLSLFSSNRQKCLLLFVIRDHVGTPLENLAKTLTADLIKIWDQLNKTDACKDLKLSDFFDLRFFALGHKVLQPDKFEKDIQLLGDEFSNSGDNKLFLEEYHRHIPIDGWTMYSEQIWEQIELNKDLDLPTQQILVARFRCDEILQQAYDEFIQKFDDLRVEDQSHNEISKTLKQLRVDALVSYDNSASRYNHSVYLQRRVTLLNKVDLKLKEVHDHQIDLFFKQSIEKFNSSFQDSRKSKQFSNNFEELLNSVSNSSMSYFQSMLKEFEIFDDETNESVFSHEKELNDLQTRIQELCTENKFKERDSLVNKIVKKFNVNLKEFIIETLTNPTLNSWDLIVDQFNSLFDSLIIKKYSVDGGNSFNFRLGLSEEENQLTFVKLQKQVWKKFYDIVHDFVSEDTVSRIIRNMFEDLFRYDDQGVPKLWKSVNEVDLQFNKARSETMKVLPIFSIIKLESNDSELIPDVDIFHDNDFEDEEDITDDELSSSSSHNFSHLLSAKQQQKISNKTKKEMEAIYIEAKRSIINNTTSIPLWIYGLLVVLGWNEFMTIVRNPLLFTLSLLLLAGFYFAYNTKMIGPIISVALAMLDETKKVVKDRLKDFLLEEHERGASPSPGIVGVAGVGIQRETSEEIPMDELNEKGEKIN